MKKSVLTFFLGLMLAASPALVLAQVLNEGGSTGVQLNPGGNIVPPPQPPVTNPNAPAPAGGYTVANPLNVTSFCGLLQNILNTIVAIGIPVAVLFLVIVGFKFILARGNPGELEVAKRNFLYTVIGIAIFIGAWAIVQVVVSTMAQFGVSLATCRT